MLLERLTVRLLICYGRDVEPSWQSTISYDLVAEHHLFHSKATTIPSVAQATRQLLKGNSLPGQPSGDDIKTCCGLSAPSVHLPTGRCLGSCGGRRGGVGIQPHRGGSVGWDTRCVHYLLELLRIHPGQLVWCHLRCPGGADVSRSDEIKAASFSFENGGALLRASALSFVWSATPARRARGALQRDGDGQINATPVTKASARSSSSM